MRVIGVILVIGSLSLSGFMLFKQWTFQRATEVQRLQMLWIQDYKELKTSGYLNAAFFDLKEVTLIPGTEKAKEWIKELKSPFHYHSEGQYRLEILVISWEDEEDGRSGGIIQYDLFHAPSNNLVSEFGRTYILMQKPKFKPEKVEKAEAPVPPTPPTKKAK